MAFIKKILSVAICLSLATALLIPASADDQIQLGQAQSVSIINLSGSFFSFVPEHSGYYRYYSYNCGTGDPYGFITDANHHNLAGDNDIDINDRNFEMVCYLEAGSTYYLAATTYIGSADFTIKIEKLADPASIHFSETAITGQMSQSRYLELTVLPVSYGSKGISFHSSAPEIAQVDEDGCVYFLTPGTATVTASCWNGLTATCTVTTAAVDPVSPNTPVTLDASLGVQFLEFTAPSEGWYGAMSQGYAIDPYLSVLDRGLNEIARDDDSVDGRNFFAPFYLQAGQTCYLDIEHYDSVGLGSLTVSRLAAPTGITLKEDSLVGYPSSYCQLTPVYTPLASAPETLTWSSTNESVATVDEFGYVIFHSPGSAVIQFTSASGKTDSVTVTVQAAPSGSSLVAYGICGANLRWQLDTAGTLTLWGTGDMFDNYDGWSAYTDRIHQVVLPRGITSIGSTAFAWCEALTQISIPDTVTHIGYDAFYSCSALTRITLPEGLSCLGQAAFAYCSALTQVDIPKGLTQLPMNCFAQCTSLEAVTLPGDLVSIHDQAFDGCPLNQPLRIPAAVAFLGNRVFRNSSITHLQFSGDAPVFGAEALSGLTATAVYPAGNSTWTEAICQSYGGSITWVGEAALTGTVTLFGNVTGTAELYNADGTNLIRSVTVDNGSYRFPDVPNGIYMLTVSAPNHVTRSIPFRFSGGAGPDVTLHLLGDVSGDGRINVVDVAQVYSHARHTSLITDEYLLACADVLTDGRISVGDVAKIYAHAKKTSPLF